MASINLSEFVDSPYTYKASFDWSSFNQAVKQGIIYLDKIIDLNAPNHALPQQRENSLNFRNCGLGVFGYATMLMKMGMEYGSLEAIEFTDGLFHRMFREAVKTSNELAKELGSFPKYNANLWNSKIIKIHFTNSEIEKMKPYGLRNCSLLSIAPTGTLSSLLNESGGCEPEFAISYTRRTVGLTNNQDHYYTVYCKAAREYKELYPDSELPTYFVSSSDIDPQSRVTTQAVMQDHVDTAISSTVNLPESATEEQMAQIYLEAWKQGLKGLTIFRDGCKRLGVLTTDTPKQEKTNEQSQTLQRGDIISCDDSLVGKKRKIMTGCVDADTEFFNGKEWKKISEYEEGDLVLQYNADGTANLVKPLEYIKRESKGQYHIYTKYGLDMMVSSDHRNVTFWKENSKPIICTTEELLKIHKKNKYGFMRKFKKSFIYDGPGIDLTDDEIRLSVAIFADGCFYSPTSKKCDISVRKERKKDRIVEILKSAGYEYNLRYANNGYYHIKFYPPIDGRQKTFPINWYNCSQHQLQVIFNEVFNWDGYEKEKNQYTTIFKENADFIQFVCSAVGKSSSIYIDNRIRNKNSHICYRVDWSNRTLRSVIEKNKKDFPLTQPEDGYDYCFSVPSTMLVLRRNNNIFITGNCGSTHILAYFDPYNGDLMEAYLNKGSTGGCANYMTGLSRMISLLCRAGVAVHDIKDQLDSTGACPSYAVRSATKHDTSKGSCCPMAIGNALVDMWEEMQRDLNADESNIIFDKPIDKSLQNDIMETEQEKHDVCPECGELLQHSGGCDFCVSCGFSHCG